MPLKVTENETIG